MIHTVTITIIQPNKHHRIQPIIWMDSSETAVRDRRETGICESKFLFKNFMNETEEEKKTNKGKHGKLSKWNTICSTGQT